MDFGKFILICGHYGCGKTNFALNLAADIRQTGERVTVVDLDIVNPYFRSSDYPEFLENLDIELIAPTYARSNVDLPSLPAEMYSMFLKEGTVILDVGGDDVGATVLGRFSRYISEKQYQMLYVVNKFRSKHPSVEETSELLAEIEQKSRLKATGVVSNAHLIEYTTPETVADGAVFAKDVADRLSLPLQAVTCKRELMTDVRQIMKDKADSLYPIDIIVKKPWEI
ncbi:MAG: ParA family protein [Oscillospiraceae bacterium]|nr:ParA family protein [Oscillospiraceae bacterium]